LTDQGLGRMNLEKEAQALDEGPAAAGSAVESRLGLSCLMMQALFGGAGFATCVDSPGRAALSKW